MNDLEDLNGVTVRGRDGLRGTVRQGMPDWKNPTRVLVALDDGRQIWVPVDLLERREEEIFIPLSQKEIEAYEEDEPLIVIPVVQEELVVGKRSVETGGVRVTKHVREREEEVDEPGYQEEVRVEHIPVNLEIDQPAKVRYEGDTLVIPIMEEALIVRKRLVLKEEVRITKVRKETREQQNVTLRSEEVEVERLSPEEMDES